MGNLNFSRCCRIRLRLYSESHNWVHLLGWDCFFHSQDYIRRISRDRKVFLCSTHRSQAVGWPVLWGSIEKDEHRSSVLEDFRIFVSHFISTAILFLYKEMSPQLPWTPMGPVKAQGARLEENNLPSLWRLWEYRPSVGRWVGHCATS